LTKFAKSSWAEIVFFVAIPAIISMTAPAARQAGRGRQHARHRRRDACYHPPNNQQADAWNFRC
jgi:hypothetical protein